MKGNELLAFRASGTAWAIPLDRVLEILERPVLVRLPLLPESAPGVISVRGEAVPALDVSRRGAQNAGPRTTAIVTSDGPRRIALLTDGIEGIVTDVPEGVEVLTDVAALFEQAEEPR